MKNMSLAKIAIAFFIFILIIIVGTVVTLKMKASKSKQFVPTKSYVPEQAAKPANNPAPAPAQGQPAQQDMQAALQPAVPTPAAGGQFTPTADTKLAATSAPAVQTSQNMPPMAASGDVGTQLVGIDAKLTRFDARIAALEARSPGAAATASKAEKNVATGRVSRLRSTHNAAPTRIAAVKPENKPAEVREATGYKTMAVVGNRAWVALPDGREENVIPGDQIPQPRPRVRSIDRDTGVVIMSSDEQINAR